YYVNTLGAGAACIASAVLLFPFLGMSKSIYVAVAMNAAVALGALAAQWSGSSQVEPQNLAPMLPNRRLVLALGPVLLLAAAGGFVSLSYEMFFFRTISYATGSSAPAFAVTLSAFLVGIASGSRRAGELCKTASSTDTMRGLANALLMASFLGLFFLPSLNHVAWLDRGLLVVFLVARFWGAVVPNLAELSIAADERAGMRTAFLYLSNILGSATGSVVTGFVLMDRFGLVTIAAFLAVAGVACALVLMT